ncbi:MAG TPA: sigma-54 dependent transcriptional regulator [Polyangiales bacterium]|nr:sigma-54 dependent transcriptional regulator [Polyangiales bacterium]
MLVVDDDATFAETLAEGLSERGWRAQAVGDADVALGMIRARGGFDALVTDLRMPDVDGLTLLGTARQFTPERPVIIMTAFSAIDSAVECVRRGAFHYLTKPFKVAELDLYLQRALETSQLRKTARDLQRALGDRYALTSLIGKSEAMGDAFDLVRRVADSTIPVLFLGETGVGKTMFARALHAESERAAAPFVSVNCAALPEALLESELFGHVRGAFTGAHAARSGLFVEADGGTLFLDEIGDMQPALQAKLLHVLESGTVRPIGASRERAVDVRILAATHRDLRTLVQEGRFREDLLYRLEGVAIQIPPLRQRRGDILLLAERMLEEARRRHPKSQSEAFSAAATQAMLNYAWPGNVRELEHAIGRAVLLARGKAIALEDLPDSLAAVPGSAERDFGDEVIPVRELQRRYASWALEKLGGRRMYTCEKLGIDSKTLTKWLSTGEE